MTGSAPLTPLVVRFHEMQGYDINLDSDMVTMMASTNTGTYSCRTPLSKASRLREERKQFKDYVIECMQAGIPPHEAELDGCESST